ncbi:MAG TPA: zf-HC2 domain-containing protein [Pyrinomonadaceae bacterium]|nr:zf-HC2 domain-containing protein [Pyrinomonadaceae bacterium]
MQETNGTNICARTEELVTYLYGEATRDEAKAFEAHMQVCASCRAELSTFGNVREAMGEWRQQSLGSFASSTGMEASAAQALAAGHKRRSSAMAALREFFTLSPTWMRAATAAAALLFCALAVIAVAYFRQQPQTVVVEKFIKSGYTEKEVEEMIAKAIKEQNESRVKDAPTPTNESITAASNEQPKAQPRIKHGISGAQQLAGNDRKQQSGPRSRVRPSLPVSTDYLPFTASVDDEKLPSLSDLVEDVN